MIYFISTKYSRNPQGYLLSQYTLDGIGICDTKGRSLGFEGPPSRAERDEFMKFIGDDPTPQFWGYYCAVDWVLFMNFIRDSVALPMRFPIHCNELVQELQRLNVNLNEVPRSGVIRQDIIGDVEWCRSLFFYLKGRD